jgi:hypothetical protein
VLENSWDSGEIARMEDFDWDAQPAIRQQIGALASGGFRTEARNVVPVSPTGAGNPTSPPRSESSLRVKGNGCRSPPRPAGHPPQRHTPIRSTPARI